MKRISFCTTWLATALLVAGCGQQPADQPDRASQPGERDVAPVEQPAATEPSEIEEPAAVPEEPVAVPEEPVAVPDAEIPGESMPPLEGPALPEPAPAAPAGVEPALDEAAPSAPAEELMESTSAGKQKSVLGAVSKSLFRAATGRGGDAPPPTFGDAPGFDAPPPR